MVRITTVQVKTNTVHKVADKIHGAINIPILHIVEVTGRELKRENITKVALFKK